MRLVATADLHGCLPHDIPECDVLVIAGDVCPSYDHSIPFQRSWLETNFSEWLRSLPADLIIGIGGNHDFMLERDSSFAANLPWAYLLDSGIWHKGIKFWGTPWVPNLSRWAFHREDYIIDDKLALVPNNADVVISHGPPMQYCDHTVPKFGDCDAGFPGTNDMLERVRPELFICGHIHEGYGMLDHPSGAIIANVAHMTERYDPINPPQLFSVRGQAVHPRGDFPPPKTHPCSTTT